jgi:hypothetical protein
MLRFTCKCGKQLHAPEEFTGRQTRCPTCGSAVTVPGIATQANPEAAATGQQGIQAEPTGDASQAGPAAEPALDPLAPSKPSGKAIASLVFGVLSLWLPVLATIPALILGFVGLRDIERSRGRLTGRGLAIGGMIAAAALTFVSLGVYALVYLGYRTQQAAVQRTISRNNLMQIGIALHNYHDTNNVLPEAQRNGLSWRVLILPYIEQGDLYDQFRLDQPWDSPTNIKLLSKMPKLYRCPRYPAEEGMTYYQALTGPQTVMGNQGGLSLMAITNANGTSNTIVVVEAGDPVPWTKPDELQYDAQKPLPAFGGPDRRDFLALFVDGHVQTIPATTPEQTIRCMINWQNRQPFRLP